VDLYFSWVNLTIGSSGSMMMLLSLAYLFALSAETFGAPTETVTVAGQSIALQRRNPYPEGIVSWGALARNQRDNLIAKYYGGSQTTRRRSTGYNSYVACDITWKQEIHLLNATLGSSICSMILGRCWHVLNCMAVDCTVHAATMVHWPSVLPRCPLMSYWTRVLRRL
jgi:hypothetical protein